MKKTLILSLVLLPGVCYSEIDENDEYVTSGPDQLQISAESQDFAPSKPEKHLQPITAMIDLNKSFSILKSDVKKAKEEFVALDIFFEHFSKVLQESASAKAHEQKLYQNYLQLLIQEKQMASMGSQNFEDLRVKNGWLSNEDLSKENATLIKKFSTSGKKAFAAVQHIVALLSTQSFIGGLSPRIKNFLLFVIQQLHIE